MRFVVVTQQIIQRTYEVEADGHLVAREFIASSKVEREAFMRCQNAQPERVTVISRVARLPEPEREEAEAS